jgi:hypothetical protein
MIVTNGQSGLNMFHLQEGLVRSLHLLAATARRGNPSGHAKSLFSVCWLGRDRQNPPQQDC